MRLYQLVASPFAVRVQSDCPLCECLAPGLLAEPHHVFDRERSGLHRFVNLNLVRAPNSCGLTLVVNTRIAQVEMGAFHISVDRIISWVTKRVEQRPPVISIPIIH